MEDKCRAVVLRSVDYKDNDKILTLFSLEHGIISTAIRGVKKAGAKLKFAAQPFCFCEYVLNKKGDKHSVVSADIIESFYPIREDIYKFYAGMVALEFCTDFAQEEMDSKELFLLLLEFFKALCYSNVRPKVALAKFLFSALAISGYEINVCGCHKCRKSLKNRVFFDFNVGACSCEECREGTDVEINPNTATLLFEVNHTPFEELKEYPVMIENKAVKLLCYFAEVKAGVVLRSASELILLGK